MNRISPEFAICQVPEIRLESDSLI